MRFEQHMIVALIALSLGIGLLATLESRMDLGTIRENVGNANTNQIFRDINQVNDEHFTISQISEDGIIDSVGSELIRASESVQDES